MTTETGSSEDEPASGEDDEGLPECDVTGLSVEVSSQRLSTPIAVASNRSNQISTQTTSITSAGHRPCATQQTATASKSGPCTGHQSYKSVHIYIISV